MPVRLDDDGQRVTLDLHGARVDQAEALLGATVRLAAARGRSTVEVVHGASTSDPRARNRTVKHVLFDLLDAGALPGVTGAIRGDGSSRLALPVTGRKDPRRITLRDVW